MIIVIVGPTGVGKTKMSIELAKQFNGEIINADSTQIFKNLDIATAKVTKEEMEGIPHHLIDIKNIHEDYTVYDYQRDCRKVIEEILDKKKTPIIVGGTGLYIKAALYDYEFEEENQKKDYSQYKDFELYRKLQAIDPKTEIHPNNRKRIERALNYYENNHQIPSEKRKANQLLYKATFIGLTTTRELLYERINQRVDSMLAQGLIKEAKELYDTNIGTKAVMTPIGYKELFGYFGGEYTYEEAVSRIKQRSRNYAKRQYTWFNHQMPTIWFNVNFDQFDETTHQVIEYIRKEEKNETYQ